MKTKLPAQVLLAIILASCSASQTQGTASPVFTLSSPTSEPLSTLIPVPPIQGEATQMNPTPYTSGLEGLIEKAKEDLSQRLSIPISEISLVEAKAVTWSDGSLGCPQPDMMYAQVLTPGYLVRLKYDSREFEYHGGKNGSLAYCENPLPPVEGAAGNN